MVTTVVGTDVYGAVRKVRRTPIVTKFMMLHFVPIVPLESYYLGRLAGQSRRGVPFVFRETQRLIDGLRLARVDRLSVVVAYVRLVAAVALLFGFIGAFFGFVASFNAPLNANDPVQRYWMPVSLGVMAIGILLALPTYLTTYIVPDREKRIRSICSSILGIAADPARCEREVAEIVLQQMTEELADEGLTDPIALLRNPAQVTPEQFALALCLWRTAIGMGGDRDKFERATDELLLTFPN